MIWLENLLNTVEINRKCIEFYWFEYWKTYEILLIWLENPHGHLNCKHPRNVKRPGALRNDWICSTFCHPKESLITILQKFSNCNSKMIGYGHFLRGRQFSRKSTLGRDVKNPIDLIGVSIELIDLDKTIYENLMIC